MPQSSIKLALDAPQGFPDEPHILRPNPERPQEAVYLVPGLVLGADSQPEHGGVCRDQDDGTPIRSDEREEGRQNGDPAGGLVGVHDPTLLAPVATRVGVPLATLANQPARLHDET